jgi:hypothetical protein
MHSRSVFTFLAISIHIIITNTEFLLESWPTGYTCTVNLKATFSNEINCKNRLVFDEVVASNKHTAVRTLSSNDSFYATQQITFFEQCSINILIEDFVISNSLTPNYMRLYLQQQDYFTKTLYVGKDYFHSIYILMKWECETHMSFHTSKLDISLFVHYLDSCNQNKFQISDLLFPSHIALPFNSKAGYYLKSIRRSNSTSIFIRPTRSSSDPKYNLGVFSHTTDKGLSCLKTRLSTEEVQLFGRCLLRDFLVQHLQSQLNFTVSHVSNMKHDWNYLESKFGYLSFDVFFENVESFVHYGVASLSTPDYKVHSQLVYCDFTVLEKSLSFYAWITPLQIEVWVSLAVSILIIAFITSIVIAHSKRENVKFSLLLLVHYSMLALGVILHQHSPRIRTIAFTCLGLSALTLTSMYENKITAELIVSDQPTIIDNLFTLIHVHGYQVYVPGLDENLRQKAYERLAKYFREINPSQQLLQEKVMLRKYNNFFNDPEEFGNPEDKRSIFTQAMELENEYILNTIREGNPGRQCYFVKKEVGYAWTLAIFNNVLGRKQLDLWNMYIQSGLMVFWRNLDKFHRQVFRSNKTAVGGQSNAELSHREQQIRFGNLIPIFAVYFALIGVSAIVLIIESSMPSARILCSQVANMFYHGFERIADFFPMEIRISL